MMHLLQLPPAMVLDKRTGKYRRKSHKIGPEPLFPNEADVLVAMRAAQTKPRTLTGDEAAAFETFRGSANIASYQSERKIRRGKLIYRTPGGGGDLSMSPVEWDARQALAGFRVRVTKVFRRAPNPARGARARREAAEARAQRVLELVDRYRSRGSSCAALIARALGERVDYVRSVLRENVRDANRQSK